MLELAYTLESEVDYSRLRVDPAFLSHSIVICKLCYAAVKKMLAYKNDQNCRAMAATPDLLGESTYMKEMENLN